MKIKDIIKKQTTIIAIAVVLVTIATIGVSYAVFFDVETGTQTQVITAGTLKLKLTAPGSGTLSSLTLSEPKSTSDGLASAPLQYTISNKDSNLPASYKIYLYPDNSNTIDVSKIKIAHTDGNTAQSKDAKVLSSIENSITIPNTNSKKGYLISSGTIAANTTSSTKYLRVWIDEDLITTDTTGTVSLQLYVISEVDESKALPTS